MADTFEFEDNSIPTYQLGDEGLEVFLNEGLEGLGEVRSGSKYRYGTITGKGYSAGFHRLQEAHGSLTSDKGDTDDASLVVLRITPRTDSQKRRFKKFTVTLTLEPPVLSSNADPPSLAAFEPAADGDEYFQEHVTSVTKTNTYQGTIGVKPSIADLSFNPSTSTARQFQDRRLLKLSADPSGETEGIDTKIKYEITPAVEKDGIGDRLAVAMIIKRARGARFFIKAVTSAEVSYRFEDTLKWCPGKYQENALRMGPFGPQETGVQTNPQGITTTNMMAAKDQGLKKLAYLHLPEAGTKKLFVEFQENAPPESPIPAPIGNDSAVHETDHTTDSAPLPHKVAETEDPPTVPESKPDDLKRADQSVSERQPAARQQTEVFEEAPPSQRSVPQQSTPQKLIHQRSLLSVQNSRAVRHRMMASHYHNLAQLHLQEAEETEALVELAHADSAYTKIF